MNSREIRRKFLEFFKDRGHEIVESASLVPKDDPSLLFTNAGMVQFKRLYLGEETRSYSRAATSQKCVRAGGKHNDLEQVGYTNRHHTFFEMLGNFSFGDYFKKEAIAWAWELLTEVYGLPGDRLYASVFEEDDEAFSLWEHEIGLPADRIVRLDAKDNFWAMGDTGPCGPCSEIYIDQGPELSCGRPDCAVGCECDRYLEIYNLVFTQFDRSADGTFSPLPKPNIDTGMGLERLAAVVQGAKTNYDTDIFKELIDGIADMSGVAYGTGGKTDVAFRVISDHSRAVAFLIGDGIMPSNEGRGYVLRRIIRRAVRFGQVLGLETRFFHRVCGRVIDLMGRDYKELVQSRSFIEGLVENEEKRFADTLHYSMKVLEDKIDGVKAAGGSTIGGEVAFKLYDTFGLSVDMVLDVAREEGLQVDMAGYEAAMARRRSMSQESWQGSGEEAVPEAHLRLVSRGVTSRFVGYETLRAKARVTAILVDGEERERIDAGVEAELIVDETPFYGRAGGQVGDSGWFLAEGMRFVVKDTIKSNRDLVIHQGSVESGSLAKGDEVEARVDEARRKATELNHSATHLLHAALREVLGDHVKQAGSLVSPERLRFDFSHFTQVPPETLRDIERLVNRHIRENMPVGTEAMAKEDAMNTGAMAIFEERYGEEVRVVRMGDGVSMELCGGTHTERTGDIGLLRIVGESSVAANVRRIEALTGEGAILHDQEQDRELARAAALLKANPGVVAERVERLLKDHKEKDREIATLKSKLLAGKSEEVLSGVRELNGVRVVARELDVDSPKELRESADRIKDKLGSGIIVVAARTGTSAMLSCVVTKDLTGRFKAGDIVRRLSSVIGGKGGGRPDMAQGGGSNPEHLERAFEVLYELVSGAA